MEKKTDNELTIDLSSLFDPNSAGLLVIDVQEKLWPFIHNRDEVGRRIIQAIKVAGHLELPILVTEQYVKGLGPTIREVVDVLNIFDTKKPMEKYAFSCFGKPDFEDMFEACDIETLAIVGIEAHVCVMQTALDALDRGIDVFFISEATGSRDPRHKEEAIARVRDAGAIVGSVEMFAFEAMRTSNHSAFKDVQKVII
ncbi:MAG: isochorismatase family protein [Proteobacteria bacterium]|nr:isochorismatase family protein [Pseudomonadota bacterium]